MKLDGLIVADRIMADLKSKPVPSGVLAIVNIGNDQVNQKYISKKNKFSEKLGVVCKVIETDETKIFALIDKLNKGRDIQGIIVQLPVPESIDRDMLLKKINPSKDVDGFHYILGLGDAKALPPTVLAIYELLNFYKIKLSNGVLIVGGGFLVGTPLKKFLTEKSIPNEVLLKDDPSYYEKLKNADVVVLATGGKGVFSPDNFKTGATVIDASTVASGRKLHGDIKFEDSLQINLSPVPGGVGPVTVAMLFENFYNLSK